MKLDSNIKTDSKVIAAITAAVTAYLEQEQQAKIAIPYYQPVFEVSQWRLFGRQELIRTRLHWHRKVRH